jgi:hypothetical protein
MGYCHVSIAIRSLPCGKTHGRLTVQACKSLETRNLTRTKLIKKPVALM